MVILVDEVDLTGEHTSVMSYTSITAGNKEPSKDNIDHDEVSQFLAFDSVVFEMELVVRDLDSGIPESTSVSGRPEVPVPEIEYVEPPLRRRSSSREMTRTIEDRGRIQSQSPKRESRRSDCASSASLGPDQKNFSWRTPASAGLIIRTSVLRFLATYQPLLQGT